MAELGERIEQVEFEVLRNLVGQILNRAEAIDAETDEELLKIYRELLFWSLTHARVVIADWKDEYNHHRRHSAPGVPNPADYAADCNHGGEKDRQAAAWS